MIGQPWVLGEKHIIWDTIIEEENNCRPYQDYILYKEMVIYSSRKVMPVEKENLNKKPFEYVNIAINFLNNLSEDGLNKSNVKDRISIMDWARKFINKHHHLDTVQAKVDILAH